MRGDYIQKNLKLLRDESGQFVKGNIGYWKNKERPELSGINHPNWIGGKANYICDYCGKPFRKYPSHRKAEYKCCSLSCATKIKHLTDVKCGFQKGHEPYDTSNRQPLRGSKHPMWKGGHTRKYRYSIRGRSWKEIREEVIRLDRNRCQVCGRTKRLNVHHIIPFRYTKDNSLTNLITLCRSCHMRWDWQYLWFHKNKVRITFERFGI